MLCSAVRKNISPFFFLLLILLLPLNAFSYDLENIRLLKSGIINYAFASWWLPDEAESSDKHNDTLKPSDNLLIHIKANNLLFKNDTYALQSALSSGAEFITITEKGSPWITDPLFLESGSTIFFDSGVVIEADRRGYLSKGDKLFSASGKENIHLYGYGAVLRMNRPDYTYPPYEEGQWRHMFSFMSCRNITVKGLTLEDSGGDGVYIGSSGSSRADNYCRDILIEDVKFSGHYRQGISVISAENLVIRNCIIENTGTHSPSAGIDFEPNNSEQRLVNCIVENCIIRKNFGPGIFIFSWKFK